MTEALGLSALIGVLFFLVCRDVWRDIHHSRLERTLLDRISAGSYQEYAAHRAQEQTRTGGHGKSLVEATDDEILNEVAHRGGRVNIGDPVV